MQSFASIARDEGACLLSILTKRTYRWHSGGRVTLADEQRPLAFFPEEERRDAIRHGALMTQGRDVWPLKMATDVIIMGAAHAPAGTPVKEMLVRATVGEHIRTLHIFGPRYVKYTGSSSLSFSAPEPFTCIELAWWNAYGGVDPMVLPRNFDQASLFSGQPLVALFPGAYPRNPCGLGYLVEPTPVLLDGLALPLIEWNDNLLTPETLVVRNPRHWWRRPSPAGFGWCHSLWFPRVVHAGRMPYHPVPTSAATTTLRELALGLVTREQLAMPEAHVPNARMSNEAASEMVIPFLHGNETVRLEGFAPQGEESFVLPDDPPKVTAQADGVPLAESGRALHTLFVDATKKEFYLLWSTRYALPDRLAFDVAHDAARADVIAACDIRVNGEKLAA